MIEILSDFDFLSAISPADISRLWSSPFWVDFFFSENAIYLLIGIAQFSFLFVICSIAFWWIWEFFHIFLIETFE